MIHDMAARARPFIEAHREMTGTKILSGLGRKLLQPHIAIVSDTSDYV
jgi:hypothetical protein